MGAHSPSRRPWLPLRRYRGERLRQALRPGLLELEGRVNLSSVFSIADTSAVERDRGSTEMNFTVTRSGDTSAPVAVAYHTVDGTAKAGEDFLAKSGMVEFAAGQATATISVHFAANRITQDDLTFSVELTSVRNLADITFDLQANFQANGSIIRAAVGDFNGDGKLDIVTGNESPNTVSVLLNTTEPGSSTATFAPGVDFEAGGSRSGRAVAVGDFNGDGKLDIAATDLYTHQVMVLLNTTPAGATTPSFSPYSEVTRGSNPRDIRVGDINQDGKPDLIVASLGTRSISIFLNTTEPGATSPAFAPQVDFAVGGLPYSVAIGDLNGDGKPDLAVAVPPEATASGPDGMYISVLLNTTEPGAQAASFGARADYPTPDGSSPQSIAVGDLNGDGKADIVAENYLYGLEKSTVRIYMNTTAPGATKVTLADRVVDQSSGFAYATIRDMNGDGLADLVYSNGARPLVQRNTTLPGEAMATFVEASGGSSRGSVRDQVIGDFNGDGKPDIALVGAYSFPLVIDVNNTPETPTLGRAIATGTIIDDDDPATIELIDGDGQSATIGSTFGTNLVVQVNNANGSPLRYTPVTFTAPASGAGGTFAGGATSVVVETDFYGRAVAPAFTANGLAGSYVISARTSGLDETINFDLTNQKIATSFSGLVPLNINYGQDLLLGGHLDAGANFPAGETVTIRVGSVVAQAPIDANGDFSSGLHTGILPLLSTPYTVTYEFAGNSMYNASIDTSTTLTVSRGYLFISAKSLDKTYGDVITFKGDEFTIFGLANQDTVTSVTLSTLGAAADAGVDMTPYAINVSDAVGTGLSNYIINYLPGNLNILPRPVTGHITVADKTYDGNTNATVLTRTLSGNLGGVSLVGGTATFVSPDVARGLSVTLVGAQLSGPLAGNYILDGEPQTQATITQAPTRTSLHLSKDVISFGESVTLTATVSPALGSSSVIFFDFSREIGTAPVVGNTATLTVSNLEGAGHRITATYVADKNHSWSSSDSQDIFLKTIPTAHSLTVSQNPATYGQPVTIVSTVDPRATGSVYFMDGETVLEIVPISDGRATLTLSLPVIGHDIRAFYPGDRNFDSAWSTQRIGLQVNRAGSVTTLTASPGAGKVGQPLTLTAAVNAGATGSVLFFDGSTLIGQAPLNGSTAGLTTSSALSVGSHDFRAVYIGDGNYLASTSPAVTQVVDRFSSSTTLTAGLTFLGRGRAFLLTASVMPGVEGGVTFYDGARVLGTGTLSGSTAILLVRRPLLVGRHTLTAAFDGNALYAGSVSNAVRLPLNSRPPVIANPASPTTRPGRPGFFPQLQELAAGATPRPSRFPFGRS